MEEHKGNRILVLGIGNYLMGDEGVGVHFAKMMEEKGPFPGVDVLDGGTGGFHLMSYLEHYPRVIFIDATLDDYPPGTIRQIRPRFVQDFPQAMSTHDIGLKDLVSALALLDVYPEISLFVVSIDSVQPMQTTLSAPIQASLTSLFQEVMELIEDWQEVGP